MGIKLDYASVYHPQTNGQVEQANGLIMSGIKPRLVRSLKESNTHWVEELGSVLWGLRTTPNRTTGVLQRCISEEEGRNLLAEIHAGLDGHHAAAWALVSKAFHTRFYWPTARADAQDLVQRCAGCQLFANQSHMPSTALQTIPITWPFTVWGLDMVGPLKGGTHKKKILIGHGG